VKTFLREAKLFGFLLFNVSVMFFALVLILAAVFPAKAQSPAGMAELARRITDLEALNLDHRLTVIETILNDLHSDHWTHLGTMIGTGLLILERGARAINKKVSSEDAE
jgi:phenylpyruvate tautomerase PptA (4-oxalocrotonate tautomerase family)